MLKASMSTSHTLLPHHRSICPIRMVALLSLLALGAALAFTACGGDDEASPAPEETRPVTPATEVPAAEPTETTNEGEETSAELDIDACALITKEEAEAVLGAAADEPTLETTSISAGCSYQTEQTEDFSKKVGVFVLAYRNADEALAEERSTAEQNGHPVVEGLGDFAYDSRPFFTLTVVKGRYAANIDVLVTADDSDLEAAKGLAVTILDRLP